MGEIKAVIPVKLIVGQIASDPELFYASQRELVSRYGEVDFESPVLDFTFTDYYRPEMGEGLKRRFIAFKELIEPPELAGAKLFTQEIEARLGEVGEGKLKRRINLDPGYLNLGKLVLASTKDHQHRLYIKDGIFAEVTLRYRGGTYAPWEWTYPDYQSPAYLEIFHQIREIFREQLKNRL